MSTQTTKVGVIGGSGLYALDELTDFREVEIMTPFGRPSDLIVSGKFHGKEVYFLPRHGRGHRLLPSELNFRANIWALKSLGVTHIFSVSAVGSLRESCHPGDLVIPDSVIDRTSGVRPHTFFGNGLVGHVSLADPFCESMREVVREVAVEVLGEGKFESAGTYVCVEGPRFSSRAESRLFRSWGADVIGMTAMPEASLAREAEIAYVTMAFVTDYDCWHETEDDVSVEAVLQTLKGNTESSKKLLSKAIQRLPLESENPIFSAAKNALMTPYELIPHETLRALHVFYGKYWHGNNAL